jgi:hypothetical protein
MTPTLARFICLARNRVCGTPLDEKAAADAQQAEAIDKFKLFLAKRVRLEVRIDLFSVSTWEWTSNGCFLKFEVDGHVFVLRQNGPNCKLSHRL